MRQRQQDRIGCAQCDGLAGRELRGLAGGAPDVQFDAARAVREFYARGVLRGVSHGQKQRGSRRVPLSR